jgi:GNAT superfamily N-acetyltransferase
VSRRDGECTIREASVLDAAALARLATQLGYPTTDAEARRRAAAILDLPEHRVLVAEAVGEVVGWIHVATSVTLESDPSGEIAGLVVDEAFRGSGIGARLIAEAEAWAASQGYGRMRVRSNVKRNRARRFYERVGYAVTKRQRNFEKRLEGARQPD